MSPGKSRVFAFGCSFTNYTWLTWPQIVAHNYNLPLYNFGKSGAGNQYIINQIVQADYFYNFQPEDLVVVCWTNVCREDRYVYSKWVHTGNIYNSQTPMHTPEWAVEWVDPYGMALRDLTSIQLLKSFLDSKNVSYKFLAMCDLLNKVNQWDKPNKNLTRREETELRPMFKDLLSNVAPSFYDVLWHNDIDFKREKDREVVHQNFVDGHPSPIEHLEYIESVLGPMRTDTKNAVSESQTKWAEFLRHKAELSKGYFYTSNLSQSDETHLYNSTKICYTEELKQFQ